MFIMSEASIVNSDYIKKICIRHYNDSQNPPRRDGLPWAVVAVMNDGEQEILHEYETEARAQTGIVAFGVFLSDREKDMDKSHLLFTFDDDFMLSREALNHFSEEYIAPELEKRDKKQS